MKLTALALAGFAALASFSASATDDYNRTINSIGATSTGAYVDFKEGVSSPCVFNIVYLPDPNSGAGKSMLAVLLGAQSRGATLAAVSYSVDAGNTCTATNIRSN
jgi:hypothetical protein